MHGGVGHAPVVLLSASSEHSGFFPGQEQRQAQKIRVTVADSKMHQPGHLTFPCGLAKVPCGTAPPSSSIRTQSPDPRALFKVRRRKGNGPLRSPCQSCIWAQDLFPNQPSVRKVTHQAYLSCHSSPESPSPRPCHSQTNRLPQFLIQV